MRPHGTRNHVPDLFTACTLPVTPHRRAGLPVGLHQCLPFYIHFFVDHFVDRELILCWYVAELLVKCLTIYFRLSLQKMG